MASERAVARWKELKTDPFAKKIITPIVEPRRLSGFSDKKQVDVTTDALRQYLRDFSKMQKNQSQAQQ
jgi:hypothetical protein